MDRASFACDEEQSDEPHTKSEDFSSMSGGGRGRLTSQPGDCFRVSDFLVVAATSLFADERFL